MTSLQELRNSKKILIAAHRGTFGGSIYQNTIPSLKTALFCGADIVEMDVFKSKDDVFCLGHTGEELGQFGIGKCFTDMTTAELNMLVLKNNILEPMDYKINRLDDVLEELKGKCFINIDRSWVWWPELFETFHKHKMEDQVIIKSPLVKKYVKAVTDSNLMYMPILKGDVDLSLLEETNIFPVAVEVNFNSEDDRFCSDEFINMCHRKGWLIWVNALTINNQRSHTAFHEDTDSILSNPDKGWGWLIDKGFDIIQTDWPTQLRLYSEKKLYNSKFRRF